jgi:hypothetical protein
MVDGLWCLMTFSTIFQLYRGSQLFGGGNLSTQRKSDLSQVTDKNYHTYLVHINLCIDKTKNVKV